jgi:hypothetical protein
MANLSVEEPYALMRARTGLWEPWAGNCPGPPGLTAASGSKSVDTSDAEETARLMRRQRAVLRRLSLSTFLPFIFELWAQPPYFARNTTTLARMGWRTRAAVSLEFTYSRGQLRVAAGRPRAQPVRSDPTSGIGEFEESIEQYRRR